MKRTLKLYSGDQGGTPGTPDRREKVKNFVVHIDEDDNASTQPQDDVPVYKGEVYFSSRPAKKRSAGSRSSSGGASAKTKTKTDKTADALVLTAFILVIVAISVVLSFIAISCINDVLAINRGNDIVTVNIPQNATTNQIIDILDDNDLISNKTFCKMFYKVSSAAKGTGMKSGLNKIQKLGYKIKVFFVGPPEPEYISGVYYLQPSMGVEGMLYECRAVQAGPNTVTLLFLEGRAKTEYYTAVVTNAYRSAVDTYLAAPSNDFKPAQWMVDEVYKISHRDYCTGFFFGSPRDDAQIYYKGGYVRSWEVAAIAVKSENGTLTVSQRNRFFEGDKLEIMNRGKEPTVITVRNLRNSLGESVDNAPNPMAEFTFDCDADVPAGAFIRRSTDEK